MVNVVLSRAVAHRWKDAIGVAFVAVDVPILEDILVLYAHIVNDGSFGVILTLITAFIEEFRMYFTGNNYKIETEAASIVVRVSFQVDRALIRIRDEVRAVKVCGVVYREPLQLV